MIPSALLPQTVEIESYNGESATGPLYDLAESYPARVEPKRRWLDAGGSGHTRVTSAVAYLRPDVVVAVGDRLTAGETVYRVLDVATHYDLHRVHHLEAALGRSEE